MIIITKNGDKEWWLNDQLHREDGPAVEHANGGKEWYLNGQLHREGGPAIENANGDKGWYLNGLLHRDAGPAIERANGDKWWFLNGQCQGPIFEVNGSFYIDNEQEISQQALAWLKANKYKTIITQNHNLICVTFENKSDAALFKLFWL